MWPPRLNAATDKVRDLAVGFYTVGFSFFLFLTFPICRSLFLLVEQTGFEPTTPCLQGRRSPVELRSHVGSGGGGSPGFEPGSMDLESAVFPLN